MAEKTHIVYYDGECGLCHAWVQFVLAFDRKELFSFKPLQSLPLDAPARRLQPGELRTIVVETKSGEMLVRSDAALYILRGCGGVWRVCAFLSSLAPKMIRDGIYSIVASLRKHLVKEPSDLCPVVPEEQRKRFLS